MFCPDQMVRRAARIADSGVREVMQVNGIGDLYIRLWTPMFRAAMEEVRMEKQEERERRAKAAARRRRREAAKKKATQKKTKKRPSRSR